MKARLASAVASACADPMISRSAARPALLHLHAFSNLAAQAKNQLPASGERKAVKDLLSAYRSDWTFYEAGRHHLVAHRRLLGPLAAAVLASGVNESVVQILIDDATAVVDRLCQAAGVAILPDLDGTSDSGLVQAVSSLRRGDGVMFSASDVAASSADTVTLIAPHPLQGTSQVVIGCWDSITLDVVFLRTLSLWPEAVRLYKAMLVTDVCALIDAVFGRSNRTAGRSIPGFVAEAEQCSHPGAQRLRSAEHQLPLVLLSDWRRLRNTVGAHVDPTVGPAAADQALDRFAAEPAVRFATDLMGKVRIAWGSDIRTQIFLIHGQSSKFAVGTVPTELVTPYRT